MLDSVVRNAIATHSQTPHAVTAAPRAAAMMVVEIIAGWRYNSMALLTGGFHMSPHALAIGLSAFAYAAARRI